MATLRNWLIKKNNNLNNFKSQKSYDRDSIVIMRVKSSLTKSILLALEKSIDGYIKMEDFIYNPHQYIYGYPRKIVSSRLSQALKRLRENGLVELINDQELVFRLTEKGLDKAVLEKINQNSEIWDGKWRLVTFDIPEKRRMARDLLRYKLKEWGFVNWQKSLWASKKDCSKQLRDFIREVGIEDWVLVIESDNIG